MAEIWEALCDAGADSGETVRVVGREGLALRVERAWTPAALLHHSAKGRSSSAPGWTIP